MRSTVRETLGIPTHGPGHLATSMAVRFRAPLWDIVGEHRHVIYFLPGNVAALPVGRGDRWLYARPWDPERERLDDLTPDDLTREVRLATGVPDLDPQIEDVSTADYGVALADRFRERSTFLIGDAAHRLTPRGATGMNTAIRDGHDLGWKLSWVLRGWAGDALLDTYEASGGRSPSTTPRARPTRAARSAARPTSCARTSAAASPTPGCPASRGARRRSTSSPTG